MKIHVNTPLDVSIIEPHAYSDKSIAELIKILGDPNNQIVIEELEKLIADFVVKYFMMYILNRPVNDVMPLEHVNMFYGWMCAWSKCMRKKNIKWPVKIKSPWNIDYFFRSFTQAPLAITMISDIASTTAMFREIIMAQVPFKTHTQWKYIGLDLWTGSGIWQIAMHIQAMRNRIRSATTMGFDNHAWSIKRTNHILSQLGMAHITCEADTTEIGDHRLSFAEIQPACICNETIPIEWMPFYADGAPSEPFFHNHSALRRFFGNQLYHFSVHFPHKVEVILSDGKDHTTQIIAERDNFFRSDVLGTGKPESGMFMRPKNIQISPTSPLIRLAAVWDELRKKTWDPDNPRRIIPANPDGRFRWSLPEHLDEKF